MDSAVTRRSFAAALTVLPAMLAQDGKGRKRALPPPILGVCTSSFALQDASPEKLLAALKASGLKVVSLAAPHFSPWKADSGGIAAMRALRTKCADAGVLIRSVSAEIDASRTDSEISRMLALANALDVRHVGAEVPVSILGRVNELARKHGVIVALRNSRELRSVTEMQTAVQSFGSLGLAPDIGRLETEGASDPIDLLHHSGGRVFELRFRAGSPKTAETLSNARYEHPAIPLFIDVNKPEDVSASVAFFREAIRQRPAGAPRSKKPATAPKKKG